MRRSVLFPILALAILASACDIAEDTTGVETTPAQPQLVNAVLEVEYTAPDSMSDRAADVLFGTRFDLKE